LTVEELITAGSGPEAFPANLRALRALRGWEQTELAEKSGVDRATISLLENGRRPPRPSTVQKLADALGVPAGTLRG
jgi:transcriptional regulator with XRE-family HTH domain